MSTFRILSCFYCIFENVHATTKPEETNSILPQNGTNRSLDSSDTAHNDFDSTTEELLTTRNTTTTKAAHKTTYLYDYPQTHRNKHQQHKYYQKNHDHLHAHQHQHHKKFQNDQHRHKPRKFTILHHNNSQHRHSKNEPHYYQHQHDHHKKVHPVQLTPKHRITTTKLKINKLRQQLGDVVLYNHSKTTKPIPKQKRYNLTKHKKNSHTIKAKVHTDKFHKNWLRKNLKFGANYPRKLNSTAKVPHPPVVNITTSTFHSTTALSLLLKPQHLPVLHNHSKITKPTPKHKRHNLRNRKKNSHTIKAKVHTHKFDKNWSHKNLRFGANYPRKLNPTAEGPHPPVVNITASTSPSTTTLSMLQKEKMREEEYAHETLFARILRYLSKKAAHRDYGYTVSIRTKRTMVANGCILDPETVVTVLEDYNKTAFQHLSIRAGRGIESQILNVISVSPHGFKESLKANQPVIVTLKIENLFDFDNTVYKAKITNEAIADQHLIVTSWERTAHPEELTDIPITLASYDAINIPNEYCEDKFKERFNENLFYCIKRKLRRKGRLCEDHLGSLLVNNKTKAVVGILTRREPCIAIAVFSKLKEVLAPPPSDEIKMDPMRRIPSEATESFSNTKRITTV